MDPDGRIAEISYSEKESKVKIIIPVKYSAETTESQKKLFSESAESMWSGDFGEYHVELKVEEKNSGEVNEINFTEYNPSNEASNVKNDSEMTIYTSALSKSQLKWTIAHEVGHLMNLRDKYATRITSRGKRTTTPLPGWSENIMAKFGGIVEGRNIKELLERNSVKK